MYKKIFKNLAFYLQRERRKIFRFPAFGKRVPMNKESRKISAYLSIYNDADLLANAIASVKNYVDELVVIDGAYDWMAPYLRALGRDPECSSERLYKIIAESGIPFKIIKKTWKNEVEKRIEGFKHCSHRFVMRIDADEILFFDNEALNDFFTSKCAVAEMYMPTYVAPGYVMKGKRLIDKFRKFPRQAFLFDSEKISAEGHLKYLWLVLTADSLPSLKGEKIYPVYEKPSAFCAHLTNWRNSDSSANRGAFYTMNWMRKNGAPWINKLGSEPIIDFDVLFSKINPRIFNEVMQSSSFVYSDFNLNTNETLSVTPLSKLQDEKLVPLYSKYIDNIHQRMDTILRDGSFIIFNYPFFLNITNDDDLAKLADTGCSTLFFGDDINDAKVCLCSLGTVLPFSSEIEIPVEVHGASMKINLSVIGPSQNLIRRVLKITVSSKVDNLVCTSIRFN